MADNFTLTVIELENDIFDPKIISLCILNLVWQFKKNSVEPKKIIMNN